MKLDNKAHPNSELSKFINAYKSASSRLIKKEFPAIRKELWKEQSNNISKARVRSCEEENGERAYSE